MVVVCKECSKKYRVDPLRMKGAGVRFKCKSCGNIVIAYKPQPEPEKPILDDLLFSSFPSSDPLPRTETITLDEIAPPQDIESVENADTADNKKSETRKADRALIGVRGKLMFFLIVPLFLAFASGYYFAFNQMITPDNLITEDSGLTGNEIVRNINNKINTFASQSKNINFGIIGGALIFIGLIIFLYGKKLTEKIKHLSGIADRISSGDLDAEINIKSKDEIGKLADALFRIQESLKVSKEKFW